MKFHMIQRDTLLNAPVKKWFTGVGVATVLTLLVGCGGSDDESDPQATSTSFSLAVSDAPVDEASEVVVFFDTVELVGDGAPISFDVTGDDGSPRSVDLLTLPGEQFDVIVEDTNIPVGDYNQLRLSVTDASYIVMNDGTFPIRVPSGELKLDGFTAKPGFDAAYTVEFDLRKSLVNPVGQDVVMLKPRGVRLVLNDDVGSLEGTISPDLLTATSCANKVDPYSGNAVYVYKGNINELNRLGDDADENVDDSEVRPYTVVSAIYDDTDDSLSFSAGFLLQGTYTLGFSCTGYVDEPETDEDQQDGFEILSIDTVEVTAGETRSIVIE